MNLTSCSRLDCHHITTVVSSACCKLLYRKKCNRLIAEVSEREGDGVSLTEMLSSTPYRPQMNQAMRYRSASRERSMMSAGGARHKLLGHPNNKLVTKMVSRPRYSMKTNTQPDVKESTTCVQAKDTKFHANRK